MDFSPRLFPAVSNRNKAKSVCFHIAKGVPILEIDGRLVELVFAIPDDGLHNGHGDRNVCG